MGRPEKLTKDQKVFITTIKDANPELKSPDVIKEVKKYLIKQIKDQCPGMTPEEIEKLVEDEKLSQTAIISFLTEINNKNRPSPLDVTWNTAKLDTESISADVIPWLLKINPGERHITQSQLASDRQSGLIDCSV